MPLQVFFHLQTYKRKNYIGKLIGLLVKKHQQRQKKCKKSKKESKLKLFAICKGVYFYLCKVKKRAFILFFFVMLNMFQHITSNAQNLVPNGNFEFYTTCPATWGHTILAYPWTDPNNSSSDYFNACAPVSSTCSVPNQTFGFWQYAHS